MLPEEISLALVKAIGEHKLTVAGVYPVKTTLTVELDATVTKGKSENYIPTVDIPLKATLAIVLKKAGFQRENAQRIIIEAMQEALTLDKSAIESMEELSLINQADEHVQKITAALPTKTRAGKTTIKVHSFKIEETQKKSEEAALNLIENAIQ
jgi:hypothetical protein